MRSRTMEFQNNAAMEEEFEAMWITIRKLEELQKRLEAILKRKVSY